MEPRRRCAGISPVLASMILVGMTVVLATLVYLMVAGLPATIPADAVSDMQFLEITAVYHVDDDAPYAMNYDSRVLLTHKGTRELPNDDLRALVFRNGAQLNCRIDTMNGVKFQSSSHTGVQKISGAGCQGSTWSPGETLTLDLNNGTLHPGDEIRVDIFSKSGNRIISSDTYRVP
ncbi:MAG TPA: type IV pilin [Methanomicrobiales archaeon]|nr:type IV pilin [Methanomicrobiales archaeon]